MATLARVFALAPDCHTSGRYQRVWQRHFYVGVQGAVPQVVLPEHVAFGWARPITQAPIGPSAERTVASERLWEQIRSACDGGGLDAVISYCFSSDVDPGLIGRTVALGIPWINFFCDSTYAFDLVEDLARVTSLNWFPERAALPRYRALGRPTLCRPYAVNPAALPECTCRTPRHALGFVGAPTGNRVLRLAALRMQGCRTEVRGEGWRRANAPDPGRPPTHTDRRARGSLVERVLVRLLRPLVRDGGRALAEAEVAPFLSVCRVVLGLNEGRDARGGYASYLKLRDVEFPGYGCCYLTQLNDDVAHAFDLEREVLTFRTIAEAASLVRRMARHPADALAIGHAARRRVLAEHTWAARLGELAAAL